MYLAEYTYKGWKKSKASTSYTILLQNIVDLFSMVVGLEHGDMYCLPYDGGVMDQPYKTLLCWAACRTMWIKVLADKQKEEMKRMEAKNKKRR